MASDFVVFGSQFTARDRKQAEYRNTECNREIEVSNFCWDSIAKMWIEPKMKPSNQVKLVSIPFTHGRLAVDFGSKFTAKDR